MSDNLNSLLDMWRWTLQAEGKSAKTIVTYTEAGRMFGAWMQRNHLSDMQAVTPMHARAFIAEQLLNHKPATAHNRYRGLRQFTAWLVREGELARDPLLGVRPPQIPEELPAVMTDAEIERLIGACKGAAYVDRRDAAMLRLLMDTGMRLSECAGLRVEDVDLSGRLAHVLGKGKRRRVCPFGTRTALALARYVRHRSTHSRSGAESFWLGHHGPMTSSGVYQVVKGRAEQAGLPDVHPHMLRHAAAHRWLSNGGQEGDLMRLMGWRSRSMLSRYAAASADERAIEAARRMALGDRV